MFLTGRWVKMIYICTSAFFWSSKANTASRRRWRGLPLCKSNPHDAIRANPSRDGRPRFTSNIRDVVVGRPRCIPLQINLGIPSIHAYLLLVVPISSMRRASPVPLSSSRSSCASPRKKFVDGSRKSLENTTDLTDDGSSQWLSRVGGSIHSLDDQVCACVQRSLQALVILRRRTALFRTFKFDEKLWKKRGGSIQHERFWRPRWIRSNLLPSQGFDE
ncbi:hypothetical protein OPV22_028540 [Ensete ventricosum]|uniref:Secreted protein n=1 Tax=Ensete ventricosum TaxID=4639 RepID=A0AAV8Q6P3_ENSVE|nr:hypothetical protein OPV22_028540 [Ensete ventricosum]